MGKDIFSYTGNVFERIKHKDPNGNDIWYARELAKTLEYADYRNFELTIFKAMDACKNSGFELKDHFGEVTEMVTIGSGAKRYIKNYSLSRYACYLVVQNSDPSKEVIALGQTYFALQTRRQELQEQISQLSENEKRLGIRAEMREHNKRLVDAARDAGVETTLD